MKKFFILAFTIISISFANAQFIENNAIYITEEINLGNYFGGDLNLNYVWKDTYAFRLGYTGNLRRAKSLPEDFTTGAAGIMVFGLNNPVDKFENIGVSVGRILKLNPSGTIRANLSIGAGYTFYTEPTNWRKTNNSAVSIAENYSYDYVRHEAVSLIINPKIEFPITKYFGFTVSPLL